MAPKKSSTHPPWTDMITECITTTPDGTLHGVSRPAIKRVDFLTQASVVADKPQFVDSKYHLSMSPTTTGQLNRAITHGTLRGEFVLPRGPSGKVKLAAKRVNKIADKPKHSTTGDAVVSSRTQKPPSADEYASKSLPRRKRYVSMAKKARVTPTPGRQVPPKKAATQRGGAKRVLARSRAAPAKTRSATRGRRSPRNV